jgi:hypothetical protein
MTSEVLEFVNTSPFVDAELWRLGFEEHWGELKRILGPVTGKNFAVTELRHRLLIDDIRRRLDSSSAPVVGTTILHEILANLNTDRKRIAVVADLVLSVGVNPDLRISGSWGDGCRTSHMVAVLGLVELVPTIFACRPEMTALNDFNSTPLEVASATHVSMIYSLKKILVCTPYLLHTELKR